MVFTIAAIVVVALIAIIVVLQVTRIQKLKKSVSAAWHDIDLQLQRRTELIPYVIEIARSYAAHERQTLDAIINARNEVLLATTPSQKAQADFVLSGMFQALFAISGTNPELKVNGNFRQAEGELRASEQQIATSRQNYNDRVSRLNTKIVRFPAKLFAGMAGARTCEYFESGPTRPTSLRMSY